MKNIYDMLNDVEIDLNEDEKDNFNDIEKKRIKNNIKKSIRSKNSNYKKYVAAASVAVISLGVFSNTRFATYAYERLNDIAENIKFALGIEGNLEEYTENINQSITKGGLTVKINEVLLDGNELLISITQKYNKELKPEETVELISESLYINGKRINEGNRGYLTKDNIKNKEFVIGYDLGEKEYKGDINVKLKIMDAYIWKNKDEDKFKRITGPWTFKFKVNGDDLRKSTKEISLNKEIKLDSGASLYIDNYRGNVVNQTMDIRISKHTKNINLGNDIKVDANNGNVVFKGKDNLGNKVEFLPGNGNSGEFESSYLYEFNNIDSEFKKEAKELKLVPYLEISAKENGKYSTYYKKIGEEFTIDLSK